MDRSAITYVMISIANFIFLNPIWAFASTEGFIKLDPTCKGKPDGIYELGCSQWYLACVAGNTFRLRCPSNLYFNPTKMICDYLSENTACNTQRNVGLDVPSNKMKCKKDENALYAIGACKREYLVCKNGVGRISKCKSGLFYDPVVQACTVVTPKSSCNPIPMRLAAFEESGLSGSICEGRSNEVVALLCSTKFFVCVDGIAVSMECPDESVYDIETNQCEYATQVFQCSSALNDDSEPSSRKVVGKPEVNQPTEFATISITATTVTASVTLATTTITVSPTVIHLLEPAGHQVLTATDLVPAGFCQRKIDGNYKIDECNTIFVSCSNNIVHVRMCAADLVFDGKTCEYRSHVSACLNFDTNTRTNALPSVPTSLKSLVGEHLCIEGNVYAEGPCSLYYVQCNNGRLSRKVCPSNSVFDAEKKECMTSSVRCNIKALDDSVFDGVPLDCEYKELLQRSRCANTFFECMETGRYALVACPNELYFDPVLKSCKPKSQIIDCDEGVEPLLNDKVDEVTIPLQPVEAEFVKVNPVSAEYEHVFDSFDVPLLSASLTRTEAGIRNFNMVGRNVYPLSKGGFRAKREIAKELLPRTVKVTNMTDTICNHVRDGNYGLVGCRSDYIICLRNVTTVMRCPLGLMYNSELQTCDYPERVHVCLGQEVVGTVMTEKLPDKFLLAAISKGMSVTQNGSLVVSQFKCTGDGFYGLGCSSTLIICSNSKPHVFTCPHDLYFDEEQKACVYRSALPNCLLASARNENAFSKEKIMRKKASVTVEDRSPMLVCSKMKDGIYGFECTPYYIKCKDEEAVKMPCAEGFKYDLTFSRCVPQKYCGKMDKLVLEVADRLQDKVAEQCKDRSVTFPQQISCRRLYYTCEKGTSQRVLCPENKVFSLAEKKCVSYGTCTRSRVVDLFKSLPEFCSVRVDGMYRHPNNCSRIIQCYKGDGFEHIPCLTSLVFNEVSAMCDYDVNHPECLEKDLSREVSDLCLRRTEGEFRALGRCTRHYYRCTWGRSVSFECPEDTVYNPIWNVCDYKENVESCT